MNQNSLIEYLYRRLKNEHFWFVTKSDISSSWENKPKKYYALNEYGELKDTTKVEKEINEYLGDGAETISEAVSLFIADAVCDGSIATTNYLNMNFKDKPVEYSENAVEVKNIEPKYIEPQITGSNKQVESKKLKEDIFDDVTNGKAIYGVYDDKDNRNLKDRYKEPTYAKRNKIRNFKNDKFTQRSIRDIINKGVTHVDYEKMPNERVQAYKNSKKEEDYFDKMTKLRKDAEIKMIDSLKKEFPEAKVSDVIESKYAGDRILLTNNGKRVTIYFMDEQGEDGKPWFMVIKNKTNKESYSGNIEDVIKYIKTNILAENKKVENVQRRLNEENNKSLNLISDMFKSKDFDSDSKAGQIVMRTSSLFNALSDKGYDVQVAFDNGESTNTILLGQQGGQIKITITDTNQPLRAFTDGSFELTEDNIKTLEDIRKEITTL